jgi:galactose mutarotase-like enzyme
VPLNTATLANTALLDLIQTTLAAPHATLAERGGSKIDIAIGTGKRVPEGATFVTWTESPVAPFFCVEPWMGPPNAPEHGIGLAHVAPNDVQKFVVRVEMEL